MRPVRVPYVTFARWLTARYGGPVRKIALNAGLGCPNKDGTLGTRGCLFCDENQAGLAPTRVGGRTVRTQLRDEIARLSRRPTAPRKYLAYLQAGSNTHADAATLRDIYAQAIDHPDVVSLAVATRPDCLSDAVLDAIAGVAGHLDVWLELGVQTANDATLARIDRGHTFAAVVDAVTRAHARGFLTCLHLIVGLPGETLADTLDTATRVAALRPAAVKFHPLTVTRGSRLEALWRRGEIELIAEADYVAGVAGMLRRLPPDILVQRIAGGGRPEVHVAPDWVRNINRVRNLVALALANRSENAAG